MIICTKLIIEPLVIGSCLKTLTPQVSGLMFLLLSQRLLPLKPSKVRR